ncbi:MAG: hypothetical protein AAB587_02405 [Patescibacteria group bacterium]
MAKNVVQDVLPPERSIRNIPVPERRKNIERPEKPSRQGRNQRLTPPPPIYVEPSGGNRFRTPALLWIIAAISVIVLFFAAGSLFVSATVKITPKQENIILNNKTVFSAQKKGSSEGLQYEIVSMSKDAGKQVEASEEKYVENRASGKVVIYNNFDSAVQRLVKNTRFETPTGLIFRIQESVVVPGKKTSGSGSLPGSMEVSVYADEAGEKYNIALSDFTVPGFKGTARFQNFYARSKTPMTGGFIGNMKLVGESDLAQAKVEIEETLKADLLKDIQAQIPEQFILYPSAVFLSFEELPQGNVKSSSVEIRERGKVEAIIFNRNLLALFIAQAMLPGWSDNVELRGIENLEFILDNKASFDPQKMSSIRFMFNGAAMMVALFDGEAFARELAGKPRDEVNSFFEGYSSVSQAKVIVTPFWRGTLPDNPKSIRIERVLDE